MDIYDEQLCNIYFLPRAHVFKYFSLKKLHKVKAVSTYSNRTTCFNCYDHRGYSIFKHDWMQNIWQIFFCFKIMFIYIGFYKHYQIKKMFALQKINLIMQFLSYKKTIVFYKASIHSKKFTCFTWHLLLDLSNINYKILKQNQLFECLIFRENHS